MRKISISFLLSLISVTLLSLVTNTAKTQVPAFGPQTFGTGTTLPSGWTIINPPSTGNSWQVVNTVLLSSGYSNPTASGESHISVNQNVSSTVYLQLPPIDFSMFTNGIIKFGILRSDGFSKALRIYIDVNNDNVNDTTIYLLYSDMPPQREWGLEEIPLGAFLNGKSNIRIRFGLSPAGVGNTGLIRIDDVTLYGTTSTHPTDYFHTRISGNWNSTSVWESSRDNKYWMPATLTPNSDANTITIRNTHTVTNTNPLTVDQLTIESGGSLMLAHDLSLNNGTGEDLTVQERGMLDLATYRIAGSGTFRLNGHLKTANPEGLYGSPSTSIATGVGLVPPGSNSIIEYNANDNQNVSALEYSNLNISGSGNKVLTGATVVSNNLQVNGGYLLLADYNLSVQNTASGSHSSYIKINSTGKLIINNIDGESKTFPIGNASYNPVTISNGGGLDWTVGIEDHWALSDLVAGTSYDKSIHRTWSITPSINPPPVAPDILLEYNDGDAAQIGAGFSKEALVQVWRKAEDNWLAVGVTQPPASTANGTKTVKISCEALYSLFAISNMDMPLPVKFRNVRAVHQRGAVSIYFTNETETNIAQYTLERSGDGQIYKPLQVISPLKNNSSAASYELRDNTPEALNLYRVKATEKSGQITYSSVVRVSIKENLPRLTVAPNPVNKGAILLQLSNVPQDTYKLHLYDVRGQVLLHQELHHAGGSSSYPVSIENLQSGTYIIELAGKEKLLQRLVIL